MRDLKSERSEPLTAHDFIPLVLKRRQCNEGDKITPPHYHIPQNTHLFNQQNNNKNRKSTLNFDIAVETRNFPR